MCKKRFVEFQIFLNFFITLKKLHGVPALHPCIYLSRNRFFNMRNGMFYTALKFMRGLNILSTLGNCNCPLDQLVNSLSLQCRNFNNFTACIF